MNSNKFLLSGIAASLVFFLAGYLVFGVLLSDFMKNHAGTATNVAKSSSEYMLWLIGVANVLYGFLLAYVFQRAGVSSIGGGFTMGATIGLLTSASTDCITYATSNISTGPGLFADVVAFAILAGIAGAVIGWIRGMGKKTA
jgi:hypothetical protein